MASLALMFVSGWVACLTFYSSLRWLKQRRIRLDIIAHNKAMDAYWEKQRDIAVSQSPVTNVTAMFKRPMGEQ